MTWATEQEGRERWFDTTLAADELDYFKRFGFVVRCTAQGTLDDGEQFVSLRFFDGCDVFEQHFAHREAQADAASFVAAMEERHLYTRRGAAWAVRS